MSKRRVIRTWRNSSPATTDAIHSWLRANCTVNEAGCWLWNGARGGGYHREYGVVRWGGKVVYVHRLSLAAKLKAANKYLGRRLACHECDVKPCCNPEHLRAGTQSKNMKDWHKRGRNKANDITI